MRFGPIAGAGVVFLCAVALAGLNSRFHLSKPAAGQQPQTGIHTLTEDKTYAGQVIWRAGSCILASEQDVNKVIDAKTCSFPTAGARGGRVLVIGNSFSAAEFEMVSVLHENRSNVVTLTSTWGASAAPDIPTNAQYAAASTHFWRVVYPNLAAGLRSGDSVVMVNDLANLLPEHIGPRELTMLEQLRTELSDIARDLERRNIGLIFQTQNPFVREAVCLPGARILEAGMTPNTCKFFTRAQTLARRQPLTDVLMDLKRDHANFYILDLLPVLCPGDVCSHHGADGTLLYRDEWSHMSVQAAELARPLFLQALHEATTGSAPGSGDAYTEAR